MIIDLLRTRASVRWFQERAIPGDVLRDMLEAGRLSPSGGNEQPWTFGVVTDRTMIAQIAEIASRQRWLAEAPLLIVLCTRCVDDARGGRDIQRTRFPEYAQAITDMDQDLYWALNQEEHQTKIAGAHIALAAWEHGVGCCWVSRFKVKRLAVLLNLPQGTLPSEILALGYPERQPEPKPKKSLTEVVFHNRFGQGQADVPQEQKELT
jgi:nitroreductase